ncbi:eukaryotic mitochondrial regulator protein-domain-containing protein [Cunninghamella echinulata]|nr:eukaryotic mitochondrial regulator protein-domain-containing protein [Cunninghamella echinulata]
MLRSFASVKSIIRTNIEYTPIRTFSQTCYKLSNDSTTTTTPEDTTAEQVVTEELIVEEPKKLSRRRRRFHEWANGSGKRFSRPAEGTTNYLGESPFPNNPLFQPRPPITDAKREDIYQLYISDKSTWTVRQLAVKFGLSLKRIEAILKLKSSEKEMEANGFVLQRQFTKGMEQYMGASEPVTILQEPLIDIVPNVGKPRFKLLEENATFTTKDAADTLNRKQYKLLEKKAIALEEAKFEKTTTSASSQHTNNNSNNSKYVIVDSSRK